jgi:NADH-quinone oxidoreductase subunit E
MIAGPGGRMLTEKMIQEIEDEAAHYPDSQAVSIEALKIVQRERGWISDESLKEVADYLGMTADELDSVATFYPLIFRQPVGRHVILLCDSVSCWICGEEKLKERFRQRLGIGMGETGQDGRFTLLPIACLGDCDHAPTMIVDEDLYHDLKPEDIEGILERYS